MRLQVIIAQIKREFWENKIGFMWAPVACALLILVLTVGVELSGEKRFLLFLPEVSDSVNQTERFGVDVTVKDNNDNNAELQVWQSLFDTKDKAYLASLLMRFHFNFYIFMIMLFIVISAVYANESLYKDRESRELLFWRSLPVTETLNVLTKLLMIFVVMPLFIMCIALIFQFIIFLVGIAVLWDTVDVFFVLSHFPLFTMRWTGALIVILLGVFPVIGWMFFSSAFVKKSPLKMSFVIPALFAALIYVLIDYDLSLGRILLSGVESYGHMLRQMYSTYMVCSGAGINHIACNEMMDVDTLLGYLSAILVGTVFIVTSIWLRNNRYEV